MLFKKPDSDIPVIQIPDDSSHSSFDSEMNHLAASREVVHLALTTRTALKGGGADPTTNKYFPPRDTGRSFSRRAVKSGKREKATDVLLEKSVKHPGATPSPPLCN
jgi:hypothetical protein